MATDAQLAANRANAARSTGPRTDKGKERASRNALKHGNRARHHASFTVALLGDEKEVDFVALREKYISVCQPADEIECFLVARMALAVWRLKRLALLETRIVSAHRGAAIRNANLSQSLAALRCLLLPAGTGADPEAAPQPAAVPDDAIADAYIRDSERGNAITKLARYQHALERSYYLALHEFRLCRSKTPA